jgi:hypothetical protein
MMATYVRYFDTLDELLDFAEEQERVNGLTVYCDKEKKAASVFGISEALAHDLLMDEYEEDSKD